MVLCQATKTEPATVEVRSKSPDGPYRLSAGAAERLQAFALRPREWFNLATLHGPNEFFLHDDFYTEEGAALQSKIPTKDRKAYLAPTLAECAGNLDSLLDFAVTRYKLQKPVISALVPFQNDLLTAIQKRFDATQNPWFHDSLSEIAGTLLGSSASTWFGEVLGRLSPVARLRLLHSGCLCLEQQEGLKVTIEALEGLPVKDLLGWCMVLGNFRDPSVLDWIETHVQDPLTSEWGNLAALSGLDWNRASTWLRSGRPLSLVALDAIVACSGPTPSQAYMVQRACPKLRSDVTADVIATTLADYATKDRSPRVSKAVRHITANLGTILAQG